MPELSVVVAATPSWGIGKDGRLPWHLRGDMDHFKKVTMEAHEGKRNAVIMGRKTYESIPDQFRPLRNRWNIVLTRNGDLKDKLPAEVQCCSSLDQAVKLCSERKDIDEVIVIGGAEAIQEALRREDCTKVWLTKIHQDVPCDIFMSPIDESTYKESSDFEKIKNEENGLDYEITLLTRK